MEVKVLKVILFSNKCPRCMILEKKLNEKNIKYDEINDIDIMEQKGFMQVPMLEVDGQVMDFVDAIKWINNLK